MIFARTPKTRSSRKRTNRAQIDSTYQRLESRQLLASVGWDGPGQGGAELTYYVGKAPEGISQSQFESTIQDALKVWSDVIDVKFTRTNQAGLSDSLDFTTRTIDGQGGVLARAYFPDDVNRSRIAGDVEFDAMDNWEVGNAKGSRAFDLLYVAVHEIGHALGIEHIDSHPAVLAPSVNGNQTFHGLSQHDIDAAMELYAPAESTTPPNDTPPNSEQPDTPPVEKPEEPTQPPTNPVDDHNHDHDLPDAEIPDGNPDPQPDSERPDSHPDPSDERPTGDDGDQPSDPTSPDDNDDGGMQPNDETSNQFRLERFFNYLFRRFRFAFWSPFQFFIRW